MSTFLSNMFFVGLLRSNFVAKSSRRLLIEQLLTKVLSHMLCQSIFGMAISRAVWAFHLHHHTILRPFHSTRATSLKVGVGLSKAPKIRRLPLSKKPRQSFQVSVWLGTLLQNVSSSKYRWIILYHRMCSISNFVPTKVLRCFSDDIETPSLLHASDDFFAEDGTIIMSSQVSVSSHTRLLIAKVAANDATIQRRKEALMKNSYQDSPVFRCLQVCFDICRAHL